MTTAGLARLWEGGASAHGRTLRSWGICSWCQSSARARGKMKIQAVSSFRGAGVPLAVTLVRCRLRPAEGMRIVT
jgi:hypothetical protein